MLCPADDCFVKLALHLALLFETCFILLQTLTGAQLQEVKSDQAGIGGL